VYRGGGTERRRSVRKVTFGVACSLEGFIAGEDDDVGWLHWTEDVEHITTEFWKTIDTVVMGRKTYDVAVRSGMAAYPNVANHVVTRDASFRPSGDVNVVTEPPERFMARLRAEPGSGICVMGGGELARSLLEAGEQMTDDGSWRMSTTIDAAHFTHATFSFLRDLATNNQRIWFESNRERYERDVREPAIRFITDVAPALARISPRLRADPRPVGGSLFRIHRDVRFSKDKSPYKTHAGIRFPHEAGKDVHTPGYYLHLEPGHAFVGVGIWHPDPATTRRIRDAIVKSPASWRKATREEPFASRYALSGDSLTRPPAGFRPDHPLIDDLKRKDFIGVCSLTDDDAASAGFVERFGEICRDGAPLVRFLCKAVGVRF
jgi:uncharacterized protein (TIGR02453 family)